MAKSLYKSPGPILFVEDGVKYVIREDNVTNPDDPVPALEVLFQVTYYTKSANSVEENHGVIPLLIYGEKVIINENDDYNYQWEVELADIMETYTSRLYVMQMIYGYSKIQLFNIDHAATNIDSEHICLYGTSGGINLTGMLPASTHPFLLARGMEEGSLHFYRSELKAMDVIYAFISDLYDDYHIETDNRQSESADLADKIKAIEDKFNLIGIWTGYFSSAQYGICKDANALLVYYHYNDQYQIYSIAIMDDPDTDESNLIRWTNSMGAPEVLLLTGELQDVSEVEKPELYINSRSTRSTERKMQRGTVTTKYSLHTGYLTPARIIALKDMLSSEEIEMQIDGQWVPVSVTADPKHAVHQREPESFELTIEALEQSRYHKPNRTVRPLPSTRAAFLQDNSGNLILDNNSNTIEENGSV